MNEEFFIECTNCGDDTTGDKSIVLKWINSHECTNEGEDDVDMDEDEDDE